MTRPLINETNKRAGVAVSSSDAELGSYLQRRLGLINTRLFEHVPPSKEPTWPVNAALHYAVEIGHRWRPLVLISAYEVSGGRDGADALDMACAIELIHCCTIILDDLPCVDDADLRRGRLTCHEMYGEAITIYASHLLYALAERLASANADYLGASEAYIRRHLYNLRQRLIDAQVQELNLSRKLIPADERTLTRLYELKASLFTSATWLAATSARRSKDFVDCICGFGKYLGMAYQLADDIADVVGNSEAMGKSTGVDTNKVNLVSYCGLDQANEILGSYWRQAIDCLNHLYCDIEPLRRVGQAILGTTQNSLKFQSL